MPVQPVMFDWSISLRKAKLPRKSYETASARPQTFPGILELSILRTEINKHSAIGAYPDRQADLLHVLRLGLQIAAHETHFGLERLLSS